MPHADHVSAPDYIDTFYGRNRSDDARYAALAGRHETETCIIGGGLAGLTTALELCRRGRPVMLLEARRIAWGASGRNGGFVSPGYSCCQEKITRKVGDDHAAALYRLSQEGVDSVAGNIRDLAISDAHRSDGLIGAIRYDDAAGLTAYRDKMARDYGVELRLMQRDELRQVLRSEKYHQALYAADAFHFHPLNYARALAREITRLGGIIHEATEVRSLAAVQDGHRVVTAGGQV